jgi:hypothetical protein
MSGEAQRAPLEILQICSWCLPQKIKVLGQLLTLAPGETVSFEIDGSTGCPKSAWKTSGGQRRELSLSHGICSECAAKIRPEGLRAQ